MIQGEIQQAQVWVVNPSMGRASEDEFSKELYNIRGALSMANAGTKHKWQPILYCTKSTSSIFEKELVRGGWPEKIAEIYTTEGELLT